MASIDVYKRQGLPYQGSCQSRQALTERFSPAERSAKNKNLSLIHIYAGFQLAHINEFARLNMTNTGRVLTRLLKAQDTEGIKVLLALDVMDTEDVYKRQVYYLYNPDGI